MFAVEKTANIKDIPPKMDVENNFNKVRDICNQYYCPKGMRF